MTCDPASGAVLFVWPPMASPGSLPRGAARFADALARDGRSVDTFDANRFFYEVFLAAPHLPELRAKQADRRMVAGGDVAGFLARFQEAGPPPIAAAARTLAAFHDRLSSAAEAYFPTRIGWGWIRCPTLKGPFDVPSFVRDRRVNPFTALAEGEFVRRLSIRSYDTVVFWVTTPAQCPAALTLSEYGRKTAPGIRRLLVAPGTLAGEMAPFFDPASDDVRVAGAADLALREMETLRPDAERAAAGSRGRVLRWRIDAPSGAPSPEELEKAERDGCWNHLDIREPPPGEDPAGRPSVHSWCRWQRGAYGPAGAVQTWPGRVDRYAGVRPLPGTPVWCAIGDPELLSFWLVRMTVQELSRWRIDESSGEAFRLGDRLRYRFIPPAALSGEEMDEVCAMVVAGGSVGVRWVRRNLERAFRIGVVSERGVIVANSSLKHPRKEYVEKVSRATGIDLSGFLERGYTSVRPEYRGLGIGTRLLEGLTQGAKGRNIFSIIGEDNIATQKIAVRNRTKKVLTFYSRALEKPVGLWMPEAVADALTVDRKTP